MIQIHNTNGQLKTGNPITYNDKLWMLRTLTSQVEDIMMETIINKNMNVTYPCSSKTRCKGFTELMIAASIEKDLIKVKLILSKCSIDDINAKNDLGWTTLMLCARNSNTQPAKRQEMLDIIKELIQAKCDPNIANKYGDIALMIASRYSRGDSSIETVKLLIDAKCNLDLQDEDGWNALMLASRYASTTSTIETVKMLIAAGCNLDLQEKDGWTALMLACKNSNTDSSTEAVKLLLQAKCKIDVQEKDGWTALMLASRFAGTDSHIETVKLLIQEGASLELQSNKGNTALLLALSALVPSLDAIKLLIKSGAKVSTKNKSYENAIQVAVEKKFPLYIVDLLINHGADINDLGADAKDTYMIQSIIDLKTQNNSISESITNIEYAPGGPFYQIAKDSFESKAREVESKKKKDASDNPVSSLPETNIQPSSFSETNFQIQIKEQNEKIQYLINRDKIQQEQFEEYMKKQNDILGLILEKISK